MIGYSAIMSTQQTVDRFVPNDKLDRDLPIALYYQVSERLRQEIRQRDLRPGDLLSTEEELQKRFQVSRATVRRALEELADEGLLTRITGKGTYVAEPRLTVQLPMLLVKVSASKPAVAMEGGSGGISQGSLQSIGGNQH